MRRVILYRRHLDARSGAGQLVAMQADGLRAAGYDVTLAARRGRIKYLWRTGRWPRRMPDLHGSERPLIVDHGCELETADVVFVHGSHTAAAAHIERSDWAPQIEHEARFFARLAPTTPIVANSELIRQALVAAHGLEPERLPVIYPGYCARRFEPAARTALRPRARRALGVAADQPLIGLVVSGDFLTRGLTIFLAAADAIARELPQARFLVVGSKRLPDDARDHRLVREGRLVHRPKSSTPERWIAALDVFLHTSRFDAYGMVVAEALALGVPVVTSLRCGIAERLVGDYGACVLEQPEAAAFAAAALRLLADPAATAALVEAGRRCVGATTDTDYGRRCAQLIERLG